MHLLPSQSTPKPKGAPNGNRHTVLHHLSNVRRADRRRVPLTPNEKGQTMFTTTNQYIARRYAGFGRLECIARRGADGTTTYHVGPLVILRAAGVLS
jgi:hypothetical protein